MDSILHDIAYGKGVFVAVGNQGRISKSLDGSEWNTDVSIGNLDLYKIIYAQDQFVAVGEFGLIINSEDGIHWSEHVVGNNNISHIVYGNDSFMVSNGMMIYRSIDTLIWEEWTETDIKLLAQLGSYVFGYKGQEIYRSNDEGLHWELLTTVPSGLTLRSASFEVIQ